jgi:hypothetical protein
MICRRLDRAKVLWGAEERGEEGLWDMFNTVLCMGHGVEYGVWGQIKHSCREMNRRGFRMSGFT